MQGGKQQGVRPRQLQSSGHPLTAPHQLGCESLRQGLSCAEGPLQEKKRRGPAQGRGRPYGAQPQVLVQKPGGSEGRKRSPQLSVQGDRLSLRCGDPTEGLENGAPKQPVDNHVPSPAPKISERGTAEQGVVHVGLGFKPKKGSQSGGAVHQKVQAEVNEHSLEEVVRHPPWKRGKVLRPANGAQSGDRHHIREHKPEVVKGPGSGAPHRGPRRAGLGACENWVGNQHKVGQPVAKARRRTCPVIRQRSRQEGIRKQLQKKRLF